MPQPMYESRAQGGPKHGVKLTASAKWDGRIQMRQTALMVYYHAGSYKWEPIKEAWIWHHHPVAPESVNKRNNKGKANLDRVTKTTY